MLCSKIQIKLDDSFREILKTTPLEEIKVKQLVESTGISRSTFYSSYENINDFLNEKIDDLFRIVGSDPHIYKSRPGSVSCIFVSISDILYENRDFLKQIYKSRFRNRLLENIDYVFDERLRYCFSSNLCTLDEIAEKKVFLSAGFKGLIDKYVETDNEAYLKACAGILQETIESYGFSCRIQEAL